MQRLFQLLCGVVLFCVVSQTGKAAEFAPSSQPADLVAGWRKYIFESDTLGAEKLFKQAFEKNPKSILSASSYSQMLCQQNKDRQSAEVLLRGFDQAEWDEWFEPALADLANKYTDLTKQERSKLVEIYTSRIENKNVSWLERELFRVQLARLYGYLGAEDKRRAVFSGQNFISKWKIIGPFDNRNREGFESKFSLEENPESIDFTATHAGRGRKVMWFDYAAPYNGRLMLGDILYPGEESMAYACTYINAEKAMPVTLALIAGGASKLWLNGKLIYFEPRYCDERWRVQRLIGVNLKKGRNQILLKIAGDRDVSASLSLRVIALDCEKVEAVGSAALADAAGAGLSAADFDSVKAGHSAAAASKESDDEGGSFADLILGSISGKAGGAKDNAADNSGLTENPDGSFGNSGWLWGARKKYQSYIDSKDTPQLYHALALLNMSWLNTFYGFDDYDYSRTSVYEQPLVDEFPKCPLFVGALAYSQLDENNERIMLERAVKLSPYEYSYQDSLLDMKYEAGFSRQALDTAKEILKKRNSATALEVMGDIYYDLEWYAEAGKAYMRCLEINPGNHYVLSNYIGSIDSPEKKIELAEEALKQLSTFRIRRKKASILDDLLRSEQGARYYRELALEKVYWEGLWADSAISSINAGDYKQAIKTYEEALKFMPQSPDLLERLGRVYLQYDDKEKGLEYLRSALIVKPDNPELQAYLKELSPKERAFYDHEVVDLAKLKGKDYVSSDFPDYNLLCLLDQGYVRVYKNGSSRKMYRVVQKVLRDNAIAGVSRHTIDYSAGAQRAQLLHARVIQPDGTVIESAKVSDYEYGSNSRASSMYGSGGMVKDVRLSQVKVGSIVDIAWTLEDIGEPLYGNNFYDVFYFGSSDPTINFRYAVEFPKEMKLGYAVFPKGAYKPEDAVDGSLGRYAWSESDLPGLRSEPLMPPYDELKAHLGVSTFQSWQELGKWAWSLFKPQMILTDPMKKKVRELIAGKSSRDEKIKAIYDFIISEIRYVSISFGRFGYTPHKVERTYSSRYGDCKDTAALFVAFLREAGIESYPALVRTTQRGKYELGLPSPQIYNHAIAYIPATKDGGRSYWLDGTTDYFTLGMIPNMDRGTKALVFGENKGEVLTIDPATPQINTTHLKCTIDLEPSGKGRVALSVVNTGEYAVSLLRFFENKKSFEYALKALIAQRFSGGKLEKFEQIKNLKDGECGFKLEGSSQKMANNVSGVYKIVPALLPASLSNMVTLPKRRFDLMLGNVKSSVYEVEVILPEGAELIATPENKSLQLPSVSYTRNVKVEGRRVSLRAELVFRKDRVSVEGYGAFKDFCNAVTADFAEPITYKE